MRVRENAVYLYVLPIILFYLVFRIYPAAIMFYGTLFDWSPVTPLDRMKFVGLQNFQRMYSDSLLWTSLQNSLLITVGTVVIQSALGLAFAVLIAQIRRGRSIYRTAYFMPMVLPLVFVGMIWSWLCSGEFGLLNAVLGLVGIPSVSWLSDPTLALTMITWANIWKWVGFSMAVYIAGIEGISQELYEAARIDGAGRLRSFWNITLPLLRTPTSILVLVTTVGTIQTFDLVWVMTRGGPGNATYILPLYMYWEAFHNFDMGYSCAISMILLLVAFACSIIYLRSARDIYGVKA